MADSVIVIKDARVLREGGVVRSSAEPCRCCRSRYELVIAGCDGTGCLCRVGSLGRYSTDNMTVDGTHPLSYIETLGSGNELYRTGGVGLGCRTPTWLAPPCTGTPIAHKDHAVRFVVEIDPATEDVKRIQSETHFQPTSGAIPPFEDGNVFKWVGTGDIGVAHGNQQTCTDELYAEPGAGEKPQATGGTGQVNKL